MDRRKLLSAGLLLLALLALLTGTLLLIKASRETSPDIAAQTAGLGHQELPPAHTPDSSPESSKPTQHSPTPTEAGERAQEEQAPQKPTPTLKDVPPKPQPTGEDNQAVHNPPPEGTVEISGHVTDHDGHPLAKSVVALLAPWSGPVALPLATCREDGSYQFTWKVPDGLPTEITLGAFYKTAFRREQLRTNEQTFEVTPGGTYTDIDFTMPQGGAVTGRVVDDSFSPLPDVSVNIYPANPSDRGHICGGAITDADGCFTIKALPPGTYEINAVKRGYVLRNRGTTLELAEGEVTPLAADLVMETCTAIKLSLASAGKQPQGGFDVTYYDADGKESQGGGMVNSKGHGLITSVPLDAVEFVIHKVGYLASQRIHVHIVSGAHCEVGEIVLNPDPEYVEPKVPTGDGAEPPVALKPR